MFCVECSLGPTVGRHGTGCFEHCVLRCASMVVRCLPSVQARRSTVCSRLSLPMRFRVAARLCVPSRRSCRRSSSTSRIIGRGRHWRACWPRVTPVCTSCPRCRRTAIPAVSAGNASTALHTTQHSVLLAAGPCRASEKGTEGLRIWIESETKQRQEERERERHTHKERGIDIHGNELCVTP